MLHTHSHVHRTFPVIYIESVPRFSAELQRDAARRFVALVDVAYEQRTRLAVSTACAADHLFMDLLHQAYLQVGGRAPAFLLGC